MPRDYQDQAGTAFQRRPENARSEEWIRAFLRTAQVAHIASARDSQPFLNPTSFWFDEPNHQIIFHSNIAGRVRSNLEANPRVCMETSELGKFLPSNVALEFSLQFRSVIVFGRARILEEPEEMRRALYGLLGKYFPCHASRPRVPRDHRQGTARHFRVRHSDRGMERQGELAGTGRAVGRVAQPGGARDH